MRSPRTRPFLHRKGFEPRAHRRRWLRLSALCAKILYIVNSSFFGLSRLVSNLSDAINLLGIPMLKNLVLYGDEDGRLGRIHDEQKHLLLADHIPRGALDTEGPPLQISEERIRGLGLVERIQEWTSWAEQLAWTMTTTC